MVHILVQQEAEEQAEEQLEVALVVEEQNIVEHQVFIQEQDINLAVEVVKHEVDLEVLMVEEVVLVHPLVKQVQLRMVEMAAHMVEEAVELVLTGRNPPDWVLERADYITEMVCRRHPYDRGISAREGIEF